MGNIDLDKLKQNLQPHEVINIIKTLEPDIEYSEIPTGLIFPTVCHHINPDNSKKKLYYYFNDRADDPEASPLFCCYTECDSTFDIYELVTKMLLMRNSQSTFSDVMNLILSKATTRDFSDESSESVYESIAHLFTVKDQKFTFNTYDNGILDYYKKLYYNGWIQEGIDIPSMEKYGIRYSIHKEQIIIPHYDMNNNLIGIRARNLDEYAVSSGNKYMPIKHSGIWMAHSLSYNLYGLNVNKKAIESCKTAWIFEGEKSVMLTDSWYHDNNISVATCGSKINKFQINLLIECGVQNAVLCYDRMNEGNDTAYYYKLKNMCNKYRNYLNFSFIYDYQHILDYKSAPVDDGKEVFEYLLKNRIFT